MTMNEPIGWMEFELFENRRVQITSKLNEKVV